MEQNSPLFETNPKVNSDPDAVLTQAEAWEIIQGCRRSVVCLTDGLDKPYGVPLTPIFYKNVLYYHTSNKDTEKLKIFKNHPNVCIVFVPYSSVDANNFTMAYASVQVFGKIRLLQDKALKKTVLKTLGETYLGQDKTPEEIEKIIDEYGDKTDVWWVEMNALKGRTHDVLRVSPKK